jgi:nucleoside-diphosphate-sugar epimerase
MQGPSQTVVVTGVSSFVGAHLALAFQGAGYRVLATLGRPEEEYSGIRARRIDSARRAGIELRRVDLRDERAVAGLIGAARPDLWIQHAGWATNYGSLDYDLAAGFETNVLALEGVYRALADCGCGGVLVSGSSAEYSDSDEANREEDACWPTTPYGLAKLAETLRAKQLALRFGMPTRVARIYIPFGPLDAPGKLMSTVLRGLMRGEAIELSPCSQQRDFVHVEELAQGYLAMARDCGRDALFDVFNLCSGTATRLDDLLRGICRSMGVSTDLLRFGAKAMRPGEAPVSFGAAAKAADLLDWRAPELATMVQRYVDASQDERSS